PVAGSFYRTTIRRCLRGKVYTVQIKGIPFAAPHGDPEVTNTDETRFGPTAKFLPLLERHRYGTILDFLRSIVWKPRGLLAYLAILRNPTILTFAVKNVLVDLPWIGKWIFLRDVRKVVPNMRYDELTYARGVGGIRPQIVDTRTCTMELGEGRIVGDRFIANVTPSPGASRCLGAAERDAMQVAEWLGATFDRDRFRADHARLPAAP
ncbi:FAD-dependent oxidoreductase, partial [Candidatus Uhrbacteria bacterium]|nr:FAD-dependent oxidoreductase [Candidatus Uhrbacteria bacterium]